MSLPYHKIDWDLVYEVRRLQGRVTELEKQVQELHRLTSAKEPPPPIWDIPEPEPETLRGAIADIVRQLFRVPENKEREALNKR